MTKKYKILTIQPDEPILSGSTFYRQVQPHRFLQQYSVFEVQNIKNADIDKTPDEYFKNFQLVQFTGSIYSNLESISRLQSLGLKVALDIDEYWHLPTDHPHYAHYKKQKYCIKIFDAIKIADHITTPSYHLAGKIMCDLNPNVEVIPNGIEPDGRQDHPHPSDAEPHRIVFGFLGTFTHLQNAQLLQPSINRLYKEFYGRFQFAVAGFGLYNDGSPVNECVEIEKIFTNGYKALSSYPEYVKYLKTYTNFAEHYGFNKPYRRYWWKQMLDYPTLYGDIDVLLLPLTNSTYNCCKSPVKIAEAGFNKRTVIAGNVIPYADEIKDGSDGFLINESDKYAWFNRMKYFIENPGEVKAMGEALYNTVKDKNLLRNVSVLRHELYERIILK